MQTHAGLPDVRGQVIDIDKYFKFTFHSGIVQIFQVVYNKVSFCSAAKYLFFEHKYVCVAVNSRNKVIILT